MNREELITTIPAVDTRSLVDKVEMNLMDFFIKRYMKPGDIIPKEMELAAAMGVSRTVIRESLNRLKTMGLVESKKHRGTVIKSPDIAEILQKSMIPRILDENTLRNIFEMRLILEVGMADFIVARATNKDVEELKEIVKEEISPSSDTLFDVDYEIKFHGKLYEITGNETLKSFQNMLFPVFNYAYSSGLINKQFETKHYVSHRELVELIRGRDAGKFRKGMRHHLENHFRRILLADAAMVDHPSGSDKETASLY
jgi:GntR family transcriptional regulator, transcriptional repressor for pyruvate dehydrogenase complex